MRVSYYGTLLNFQSSVTPNILLGYLNAELFSATVKEERQQIKSLRLKPQDGEILFHGTADDCVFTFRLLSHAYVPCRTRTPPFSYCARSIPSERKGLGGYEGQQSEVDG